MYSRAAGGYPVRLERSSTLPWDQQMPDVAASVSADGRKLRIYAVNRTPEPLRENFHLDGFKAGAKEGTILILEDHAHAGTAEIMNSRDDPRRISLSSQSAAIRGTQFQFTFNPFSVTLLELNLQP
jgi:alpha-L-arabinofuranosidase